MEELSLTSREFQNVMNASDIGAIFLDRSLCVQLSTPKARQIFDLLDTDIGRPLTEITSSLRDVDIHTDVKNVLDGLQNVEREVPTEDERWHLMRVLPYRAADNRVDGVVVTFQDITALRHAEQLVRQSEESAQAQALELLRRIVGAQEDERRRISHELHDEIGQQLTALRLALEREQASPRDRDLSPALELTSSISRGIDFIAWQLRPAALDELGLAAALPRFVSNWSAHVGIHADCRVERYRVGMLTSEAEVTFYRVLQETLHNIAKHARARRADVVLTVTSGQVVLIVEDDGIGFDVVEAGKSDDGLGIAGMRERAALVDATLQVESEPGRGTSVFLRAAIAAPPPAPGGGAS